MEHLTSPELMTFILVMVGLAAVVTAVDKGIDAWKHLSGAKARAEHDAAVDNEIRQLKDRMLAAENRLTLGDQQFDSLETDMTQILSIMSAQLLHMITGNGEDALKACKAQLDEYMARRR